MKKTLALLLAAVMLLSMTACGGSAEPVETAPATTEVPTTAPTEAPTEEPTEAPTEAPTEPRVAPTVFEAVDPATLPEPIPVEEQLQSEGTQTVTLGSLEEYEDLLWELGFGEVRLSGSHKTMVGTDAFCEPVSLTYNDKAFRLDFLYCIINFAGQTTKEDGWMMYGTKSNTLANVTPLNEEEYGKTINTNSFAGVPIIVMGEGQSMDSIDISQFGSNGAGQAPASESTPNIETETMNFISYNDESLSIDAKAVYYPTTGNLYNYYQDIDSEGIAGASDLRGQLRVVGIYAEYMCFHYLFPAEDAAE